MPEPAKDKESSIIDFGEYSSMKNQRGRVGGTTELHVDDGHINLEYSEIPKVLTSTNGFGQLRESSQMMMFSDVSNID